VHVTVPDGPKIVCKYNLVTAEPIGICTGTLIRYRSMNDVPVNE